MSLADTEPYQDNLEDLDPLKNEEIVVETHRTNLKNDVINAFKSVKINQKVKFKIYDPTGKLDEGIGIGVDRDVYSSVWLELMDSLFVGSNERFLMSDTTFTLKNRRLWEIYFFMVLRHVPISRYNYQELL